MHISHLAFFPALQPRLFEWRLVDFQASGMTHTCNDTTSNAAVPQQKDFGPLIASSKPLFGSLEGRELEKAHVHVSKRMKNAKRLGLWQIGFVEGQW